MITLKIHDWKLCLWDTKESQNVSTQIHIVQQSFFSFYTKCIKHLMLRDIIPFIVLLTV